MAKTEYVDITPGLANSYFTNLRSGDRFVYSRVLKKILVYSRKKKKGLSARSLLPQISALWSALSDEEKLNWSDAGECTNLNGWRLFVQDTSARIINEMSGVATPSLFHQSWVGNLHIESPATQMQIVQYHPRNYWVSKKVPGKKGMYQPVLVTEDLALPFVLSLNYKSNLSDCGANAFAKCYVKFWYSYQGVNRYHESSIDLDDVTDWKSESVTLTTLVSYVVRYDIYFHIFNKRGDVFFDNVSAFHSGQNWARDPFCLDINQGFTRAFYQIPKHWSGVILPDGSSFNSVYQDF